MLAEISAMLLLYRAGPSHTHLILEMLNMLNMLNMLKVQLLVT